MTTPLDPIVLVRAQKEDMMTMITAKKEERTKTNMTTKTITAERTATLRAVVAVVAVAEVGAVRVVAVL